MRSVLAGTKLPNFSPRVLNFYNKLSHNKLFLMYTFPFVEEIMLSVENRDPLTDNCLQTQNPSFLAKGALLAKKVGTVALKGLAALGITAGCIVGYGVVGALCGAIALPAFIVVAAVVLLVVGIIGGVGAVLSDPSMIGKLPKDRPTPDPTAKPRLWIATKAFLLKTAKFGSYLGGFLGACVGLKVGIELSWNIFVKNKHVTDESNSSSILKGLQYIGIGAGAILLGPAIATGGSVNIASPGVGGFKNGILPSLKI